MIRTFYILIILLALTKLSYSQKTSSDSTNIDVFFKMSLEELVNIKIKSADKSEQKVVDIPASVIIIRRNEIEASGYQNLDEILQNIPGLYPIDDKFWMGGINYGVRGDYSTGSFNDMIILVNGVSQREDYYDSYNLAGVRVPVEAIDKIEIIKGPMSIMYGSGAFMGVINIITNDNTNKVNLAKISYGSGNSKSGMFRISNNIDDLSFTVNAGLYDDDRKGATLDKMITFPTPDFWGPHSKDDKLTESLNKKYFGVSVKYNGFNADISHVENIQNITDGYVSMNKGAISTTNRSYINLSYKKEVAKNFNFTTKYTYSFNNQINNYNFWNPTSPSIKDNLGYASQNTKFHEFELNSFWQVYPKLKLQVGLFSHLTTHIRTTVEMIDKDYYGILYSLPQGDIISTNAAYINAEYRMSDKLLLVAGLRLEKLSSYSQIIIDSHITDSIIYVNKKYKNNKVNYIPRLAAIYNLNSTNVFKVMYGKSIKSPSYGQNNEITKAIWRKEPIGKGLVAAEIQTIEFNYLTFFNQLSLNLSIFNNQLVNLISRANSTNSSGELEWYIANAGKISTTGIALSTVITPIDKLKFDLSVTYQKSKDIQAGNKELGYSPNILGYAKIFYNFHKKSVFSIIGRYVDDMYTKYDIKENQRIGNEKVDSYFIIDLNLRFNNILNKGIYTSFKVNNIFDETIIYPTTENSLWADKGTIGLYRSFYINLGIKF